MAKNSAKKSPLLRPRRRLRLELIDESRLERVWGTGNARLKIILAGLTLLLLGVLIGVLLVGFSPVKRKMPGYMTGQERARALSALMRVDSMQTILQTNQAFLDNFATLLDTDRTPSDSVNAAGKKTAGLSLDSLVGSSARERKFVEMMEESEKYNLKVLSPIEAEGMLWSDPVSGGIIIEQSRTLPLLRFIVPKGRGVNAVADGRVIDISADGGSWSMIIMHPHGFVSRYSSVGKPLVSKGERVLAGQILTLAAPDASRHLGLEMWRDGTPLIPADYVGRLSSSAGPGIEAPRGK